MLSLGKFLVGVTYEVNAHCICNRGLRQENETDYLCARYHLTTIWSMIRDV
jgi:hypothetical protein